MITVKLYGLLRIDSGIRELHLDADSMVQVKQALLDQNISPKEIDGCVIFINGKPGRKRSKLEDGDQVVLMSPVAGG